MWKANKCNRAISHSSNDSYTIIPCFLWEKDVRNIHVHPTFKRKTWFENDFNTWEALRTINNYNINKTYKF